MRNLQRIQADFDNAQRAQDHGRVDVTHVGDAEGLAVQLADADAQRGAENRTIRYRRPP